MVVLTRPKLKAGVYERQAEIYAGRNFEIFPAPEPDSNPSARQAARTLIGAGQRLPFSILGYLLMRDPGCGAPIPVGSRVQLLTGGTSAKLLLVVPRIADRR